MATNKPKHNSQHKPDKFSKQIENMTQTKTVLDSDTLENVPLHELEAISNNMVNINSIAADIIELYPEVELVMEIMTSLIISPNDAETETLLVELNNDDLPASVLSSIRDMFDTHIDKEYHIIDKLDDIIKESLYTHGSYVELNIPTMFINDMLKLNKTTLKAGLESYVRAKERTENVTTVKDTNLKIEITDSLMELTLSTLSNNDIKSGVETKFYNNKFGNKTISSGTESLVYDGSLMFANGYTNIDSNIDKPIVKKVNPSSIIPIADANNPKIHYGYFYLVGKDGRDISTNINNADKTDEDYLKGIFTNINTVKNNLGQDNVPELSNIQDMKKFLLKDKLNEYVTESKLDFNTDINIEIDDTLAITLAEYVIDKVDMKVIYLPKELVSYYAINYRSNGTGKGLLERVATLASIRGIMTFTNILAFVKSSVSTTEVSIDLDPDDPTYRQTVKKVLAEVVKNQQYKLPIRMLKADAFIQWTRKLGYRVKTKHPEFPDMNIELSEVANEVKPVDTELFEKIDKHILTSLYFSPEMLEESYNADFATQARQQFFILNKRVKKIQKTYNQLLSVDIRKKLLLDGSLIAKLETLLTSNIKDIKKKMVKNNNTLDSKKVKNINEDQLVKRLMFSLINNTKVSLQKPDVAAEEVTTEKFGNYTDMLDDTLDKLFSEDALPEELIGDLSGKLGNIKSALKTVLIKKYMANNKILPEFNRMFTLDENGKPDSNLLDEFNTHTDVLKLLALPFIKEITGDIEETNKDVEKATTVKEEGSDEETSPSNEDVSDTNDTNSDTTDEPVDNVDDSTDNPDDTPDIPS